MVNVSRNCIGLTIYAWTLNNVQFKPQSEHNRIFHVAMQSHISNKKSKEKVKINSKVTNTTNNT